MLTPAMNKQAARAATAALVLAFFGGAGAAELKIASAKAYAFLEHVGKLSDDLISSPAPVNAPKGGAPGDTATHGAL
jgi:hypothetical protein